MSHIQTLVDLLTAGDSATTLSAIEDLPIDDYVEVALQYIANYPFEKEFSIYHSPELTPHSAPTRLDGDGRNRFRLVLSGLVNMDRTVFTALDAALDPALACRNFIREEIFARRMQLEEQGSKYWALLEFVRSQTRAPLTEREEEEQEVVLTDDEQRIRAVVKKVCRLISYIFFISKQSRRISLFQVQRRDNYHCRISGVQLRDLDDGEVIQFEVNPVPVTVQWHLYVCHALPYSIGENAWAMLRVITGLSFNGWNAFHEQNGILLFRAIYDMFANFRIYFELDTDNVMVVRYRTQPARADPTLQLGVVVSPRRHHQPPMAFDGESLRPVPASGLSDPSPSFFSIHKALGDVFWLVAAVQPQVLRWHDDDTDRMF
ncbi:hypothetical protein C8R43DRAFT_1238653 [Mycena crocata]|nr:hypothetical protein C8R43DRAFT_1238653 [Mycena crocata]